MKTLRSKTGRASESLAEQSEKAMPATAAV
uniref:Uncharacterized protein n=1 Tax=Anguilla anguilla TaxID=7936 RepID=A0A0E9TD59_ANGAN